MSVKGSAGKVQPLPETHAAKEGCKRRALDARQTALFHLAFILMLSVKLPGNWVTVKVVSRFELLGDGAQRRLLVFRCSSKLQVGSDFFRCP